MRAKKINPSPKAVEAITEIITAMQKAWDAGDIPGLSAKVADDVDLITAAGVSFKGKKDLDQHHTEIFQKYFKGSRQAVTVRQTRFVRPRVVVCDADEEITHYKALPPGLATKPGQPLRLRTRYVLTQEGKSWVITSIQSTERHDSAKK
jgi:uncharacterized protein (TIGR02246 family)